MKQSTKNILMFIGGFIWAMKTTTKAYAPTIIKTPAPAPQPQSQADCPKDTRFVMGRHGERSCRDFRKTCPKGSEFAVVDTFVGEKCRCPDGMVRKPVFMKAGAYQTLSAEAYMVEKRNFNERQVKAPCITEAEAEMIRITQPK